MAKSMRFESGVDRISALPDEVLCHILSFVPTEMAVRTSVLSTRWRCLYTLVSSLDFVMDKYDNAAHVEKRNRFVNFVERVLLLRTRPVERFRFKFHNRIDLLRMDGWIRALVLRNIQELDLCSAPIYGSYIQQLPGSLFSCKTLVALKLKNGYNRITLEIPAKVFLPNLKVLHIVQATISYSIVESVERLLSSCPIINDLVLNKCIFVTDINGGLIVNIYNATLKRLTITSLVFRSREPTQIVISCPTLVYLNLDLSRNCSVVLVAPETLANVVIGSDSLNPPPPNYASAHAVLMRIRNTHSLQILDNAHIIQGLYNQNLPLPLFERLAYLKICDGSCLFDSRCLEYLLVRCVVLETLVFEQHTKNHSSTKEHLNSRIPRLLKHSQLTGLLSHLKTMEFQLYDIMDAEVEVLVKLIKFFLNNAKVLEKLYVRVNKIPDEQKLKITKAAMTLPRVSKKCRVFVDKLS